MNQKKLSQLDDSIERSLDPKDCEIYGKDWTNYFKIQAAGVVFPKTTEEVQSIVHWAIKEKIALVPSGGRTGLSGGAVASQNEVVVSFEKMNQVLDFSPVDQMITVEPGVITAEVHQKAQDTDLLFPVDFAASGSSQIGGNIATNVGGVRVLRYGNIRNWVAGLEVVTGSGDILQLNEGLVKNATGFDLRHLFIGSEGCLGFITKAHIKLTRRPENLKAILLAVPDWETLMQLYAEAQRRIGLTAFELFTRGCLQEVLEIMELDDPLTTTSELYVLLEAETQNEDGSDLDPFLDYVFENQLAVDGTMDQSPQQYKQLWSYRENITESISRYTPYKNDVAVRTSKIPSFVYEMESLVKEAYPDFRVLWFGHVGDGNLHINILKPSELSTEDFVSRCKQVDTMLFEILQKFKGSISAEHGVGLTKRDFLHYSRSKAEIALMRSIKQDFDPHQILNPGKLFSSLTKG